MLTSVWRPFLAVLNILGIPVDRTLVLREGLKPPEWTRKLNPWPPLQRNSNSGLFSFCIGTDRAMTYCLRCQMALLGPNFYIFEPFLLSILGVDLKTYKSIQMDFTFFFKFNHKSNALTYLRGKNSNPIPPNRNCLKRAKIDRLGPRISGGIVWYHFQYGLWVGGHTTLPPPHGLWVWKIGHGR